MEPSPGGTRPASSGRWILPAFAATYFLIQFVVSGFHGYGYFIDELYYIACSRRPDLGYVDHPPLAPLILQGVRALLGDSLPALRLLPALAGAATVFLAGLMARRLGGGRFAEAVAALSAAVAPICLIFFGIYTMNAFEILFWSAALYILVLILQGGDPRLWLLFGLVAGLAMENKHTFVLLAAGLAVGFLLTPARRHLRSGWLWLGALVALALFLPNLIWQVGHDWVSLEFYRSATLIKNVSTPPLRAIVDQLIAQGPATLPVWACGLGFLLFAKQGAPFRPLGWLFLTLFATMLGSGLSRPDRIAGAYPILFAAGAVAIERAAARPGRAWLRIATLAWLGAVGAALAPLAIPVLPPAALARYAAALGVTPQIERGKPGQFPQWFADRFGWEEMVAAVAGVHQHLPQQERERAVLVAGNYGNAGALELFGPAHGLPRVISTHNSYHLWGPGVGEIDLVIAVGSDREDLEVAFEEVVLAAEARCDYCHQDGMPIYVARRPRLSVHDLWPQIREFE